jgi:threonine synthase
LPSSLAEQCDWILVATAHPAKFETIVEPLIGETIALPPELAAIMSRPTHAVSIEANLESLAAALNDVG